jgi:uncharacterized membrane-anchored protein YhcB (DUF1043 family)
MDKTMKLWHALALNILTGVITGLTLLSFTRAGQKIDKNDEVIKDLQEKKANVSFVIDQDNIVKENLKTHIDTDDKRWNQLFGELQNIKSQQNIIITKLIK